MADLSVAIVSTASRYSSGKPACNDTLALLNRERAGRIIRPALGVIHKGRTHRWGGGRLNADRD